MSITIQTNVSSLVAQDNLRTNSDFQARTIARLTSGYRITQSGDDAAGLAVANNYRSSIMELTQGVRNANDGISTLQIVDSGVNNITKMLDRLKTLATQSASTTFSGNRAQVNLEYQQLVQDITRQASNIGLNSGGTYNVTNNIYIGGGNSAANAQVQVDLSGVGNAVDSASLNLSNTSVLGGGTMLTGNTTRLDAPGATFVAGGGGQTFTFNLVSGGSATSVNVTVGGAGALTKDQVLSSLNGSLAQYGIYAQVGSNGQLDFGGGTPFTVTTTSVLADKVAGTSTATNGGVYSSSGAAAYVAGIESITFQNGQGSKVVALGAAETFDTAIAKINAQTSSIGIFAVRNAAGNGVSLQSTGSFTASSALTGANTGVWGAPAVSGAQAVTAPTAAATVTGNALAALTSITTALSSVGNVQAQVGAGQNKLTYAISLAQSQITNYSAAESRIRDADVAAEAANLTKAQVLQQASLAAMAQANTAPQAVLALLRG